MHVRVVVCLLTVTLMVLGCASTPPEPPKTYEFDSATIINADFNVVWAAAVEFVAITGLPIHTIDKDSGTIVSSSIDASRSVMGEAATDEAVYCDCGTNMAWTAKGQCIISVSRVGEERTELDVEFVYRSGKTRGQIKRDLRVSHKGEARSEAATAKEEAELAENCGIRECSSTGYLEGLLHAYIRAKAEGGVTPRVPVFRSRR